MNIDKQDLMKWLTTLGVDHSANNWYNDPVYHPNHLIHLKYFRELATFTKTIDPRKIIGIDHGFAYNYVESHLEVPKIDWSDLLAQLKNISGLKRDFKDRDSLLVQITESTNPIQVYKYGDHYFSTNGQHRLCLAKFMGLSSIKVEVVEHYFDKRLFLKEMYLEKYIEELIFYGFAPYINNCKSDQNTIMLKIDGKSIFVKKSLVADILVNYKSIKKSWIKTFLLGRLTLISAHSISSVSNFEDIKKLYPLLARHYKKYHRNT